MCFDSWNWMKNKKTNGVSELSAEKKLENFRKKNVEKIALELNSKLLFECDVSSDKSIETMYQNLSMDWKKFDGFVHSIGFAPANELEGNFVDAATREGLVFFAGWLNKHTLFNVFQYFIHSLLWFI